MIEPITRQELREICDWATQQAAEAHNQGHYALCCTLLAQAADRVGHELAVVEANAARVAQAEAAIRTTEGDC